MLVVAQSMYLGVITRTSCVALSKSDECCWLGVTCKWRYLDTSQVVPLPTVALGYLPWVGQLKKSNPEHPVLFLQSGC